ncbi:hypothetical protein CYMTET_55240 [Cymbomonas tetramitiformis]|uniref:F-box domain-containing protein n=1 Tax=Cymbomonas tetramitiformis TaxID=36881 RepID=A0AAE0BES1_9CHLO|nr:hypothetical protein CYMTET_55240 [Cymbomonas tetramitiformis]|eukprot:gene3504-4404_t
MNAGTNVKSQKGRSSQTKEESWNRLPLEVWEEQIFCYLTVAQLRMLAYASPWFYELHRSGQLLGTRSCRADPIKFSQALAHNFGETWDAPSASLPRTLLKVCLNSVTATYQDAVHACATAASYEELLEAVRSFADTRAKALVNLCEFLEYSPGSAALPYGEPRRIFLNEAHHAFSRFSSLCQDVEERQQSLLNNWCDLCVVVPGHGPMYLCGACKIKNLARRQKWFFGRSDTRRTLQGMLVTETFNTNEHLECRFGKAWLSRFALTLDKFDSFKSH